MQKDNLTERINGLYALALGLKTQEYHIEKGNLTAAIAEQGSEIKDKFRKTISFCDIHLERVGKGYKI
jgi:xylose isomerase